MLIECLIQREGFSVVNVQRNMYEFRRNELGIQVCDILSGSHVDYLLKLNDFRLYKAPEPVPEPVKYICDRCSVEYANAAGLSAHKRSKGYQNESIADTEHNQGNLG